MVVSYAMHCIFSDQTSCLLIGSAVARGCFAERETDFTGRSDHAIDPCQDCAHQGPVEQLLKLEWKRESLSDLCVSAAMSRPAIVRGVTQSRPFVCARCVTRIQRNDARSMHAKTAARKEREEMEWQNQAQEVRHGKRKSLLSTLEERGFIKDIAGYVSSSRLLGTCH